MLEAPTLYPTWSEFQNFKEYVSSIRNEYQDYGIVKIVPPTGWKARNDYHECDDIIIDTPIQQIVSGSQGTFQQYNIEEKSISVKEFKILAEKEDQKFKINKLSYEDRERAYWRNITLSPPVYGADMPYSLFDESQDVWNLNKLDNILNILNIEMPGINEPYLYWGMWKATFAWHIEDMELYSINYLHFGSPKVWYAIPHKDACRFERIAKFLFPAEYKSCKQFLRHKQTIIHPNIIKSHNIQIYKVIQEEGQFVITFPRAYHSGFNHGFNCAEAVNFALVDWIPFGITSKPCLCDKERAIIHMESFLQEYSQYGEIPYDDIEFFIDCCRYKNKSSLKEYPKLIMKIKTKFENGKKRKAIETRTIPTDLSTLVLIKNFIKETV